MRKQTEKTTAEKTDFERTVVAMAEVYTAEKKLYSVKLKMPSDV